MNGKVGLIAFLAVALLGGGLYLAQQASPPEESRSSSVVGEAPMATLSSAPPSSQISQGSLPARPVPEPAPAPGAALRVGRTLIDETDTPCVVFSAPLGVDSTRIGDFLSIDPSVPLAARVDESRLCLSGLRYGVDYTLTLRAGLPAREGAPLAEEARVALTLGDRPASVAFGGGFILPREARDGLPVTTVNVETLDLKLYRVGDRLLARLREAFVDQREMWAYEANQIGDDMGQLLWSGEQAVTGERNATARSLIPVTEMIGPPRPGAYLLLARAKNRDENLAAEASEDEEYADWYERNRSAAQWIVQTDIGLTSFRAADGLTVLARSLSSARALAGTKVSLIARNNETLDTRETDAEGRVRFPAGVLAGTGGMAPVMLMAYREGDFNFFDLRLPEFDLSDRGVDGRAPAGAVDAFVYADRGIYRPGETVHLVGLVRDAAARALPAGRYVMKLIRPNGKEYTRYLLDNTQGGAVQVSAVLPVTASRGVWRASLHTDPEAAAVGELSFDVQDFVPQRLALDISGLPAQLHAGERFELPVAARFLYGAPASGLGGEAELILEPDPAPFSRHKGFSFGVEGERFQSERQTLEMADTDEAGQTRVTGAVPADVVTSLPLRADIGIAVREPGGRATGEHVFVPVRTRDLYLGIKPRFESSVPNGQPAQFEILAVDAKGTPMPRAGLRYRVLKDVSTWQWHRIEGRWQYERVPREREIAAGSFTIAADAPGALSQRIDWGRYRLVVSDPETGAESTLSFYGGWYGYGEASSDRPDRLAVAADKPGYAVGETARLHVESETGGEALLVIANEQVHELRNVTIPAGGGDIDITLRKEWGAGAYALVTLYRPVGARMGHAPVRAVGLAWLGLDATARTLKVEVESPGKVLPRQTVRVPVRVEGGRAVHLTLAAVDQGILQLTRFATPSPQKYYLSKRRLGAGMRDDYGRLIRGLAAQGEGEGGDAIGGKGLDVVPVRSVALFSGLVEVPESGRIELPLEIPDFQGELRLMVVAYDADKLGSAEAKLTVRDPLVAELILPRFLAPGDRAGATVLLHNVEGAAGDYQARVSADGVVEASAERAQPLAVSQREVYTVPLVARDIGFATVHLTVNGPGGFALTREWPLQVRPAQAPLTREEQRVLASGEEITLDATLLAGLLPGSVQAGASFSRFAGINIPGLLKWLDRYPYGCLEQTTSRAMPLLYFNEMAALIGRKGDRRLDARVQEAVDRVIDMQLSEGGFNMWGAWGSPAQDWIGVFALDFLMRAAAEGFVVPQAPLRAGERWLAGSAMHSQDASARAYAAALLAPRGKVNPADLRYFQDQNPPPTAVGMAHLGLALQAIGERTRAQTAFAEALKRLEPSQADGPSPPYGGRLRDTFAVASILADAGRATEVPSLLETARSKRFDMSADWTTTQEKAWMLLTAAALARNAGKVAVSVDGQPLPSGDPVSLTFEPQRLQAGVKVRNEGEGSVFSSLSVQGVPLEPQPARSEGMRLSKRVHTLDGQPADMTALHRNDRLLVVVEGEVDPRVAGEYALLDLLPAGWEIEAALRPEQPGYPWLEGLTETTVREKRDDRFVAAFTLPTYRLNKDEDGYVSRIWDSETYAFRVAYLVRAVTAGEFALPAATAENMYVPTLQARTEPGRVLIGE